MVIGKHNLKKNLPEIVLFLTVFIAGILYIDYTWHRIEERTRNNVLQLAESIEVLLPHELLDSLGAVADDTAKDEYIFIKNKLIELMKVNPQSRFSYLYTMKDGKIYFIVDSEPSGTPDCSPAGQEYSEADSACYIAFMEDRKIISDPEPDRWGTWISVLIPVKKSDDGRVTAVFGMDFNAKLWNRHSFFEIAQSSVIVLMVFSLLLFLIIIRTKNKNLKIELQTRKTTEIALRESVKKYRQLADKMTDVVWLMDFKGKSLFVSPSIESFTGYTVEEYMEQTISDRFTPESAEAGQKIFEEEIKNFIAAPEDNYKHNRILEMEYVCKDGTHKWGELIVTPYIDDEGTLIGIHGVTRDITSRKQTEKELILAKERAEESDKLKSAFLSNMSHEIRTPMNGIMGFASLLKRPDIAGEKQMIYVDLIEKSGTRMLNIINDIIDISKIESGQMSVFIAETDVNALLGNIYDFFLPEATERGIELKPLYENSAESCIINTDPDKLYAILANLIKNALKFTKKGSIEFGYRRQSNFLAFYVRDTGKGIPEGHQKLIFERFRQGSESYNREYEGAGLGLSISKAYVEMLGGSIRVESKYDSGSVFYFTIADNSSSDSVKESVKKSLTDDTETTEEKLKIIIAEDNEISMILLKNYLQVYSSSVYVASDGNEVVEICRMHQDADVIFMDIKMPGLSGLEATRQIREFNKDIIIIAQTAFALKEEMQNAFDAGCNDYIAKPYSEGDISALIMKWFG